MNFYLSKLHKLYDIKLQRVSYPIIYSLKFAFQSTLAMHPIEPPISLCPDHSLGQATNKIIMAQLQMKSK